MEQYINYSMKFYDYIGVFFLFQYKKNSLSLYISRNFFKKKNDNTANIKNIYKKIKNYNIMS